MEIEFTPELMAKAKQAKSHSELLELGKENGIDLSEKDAKDFFERLKNSGELSDDELDNVSGGCGGTSECPFCGYPICKEDNWVCRSCGRGNG